MPVFIVNIDVSILLLFLLFFCDHVRTSGAIQGLGIGQGLNSAWQVRPAGPRDNLDATLVIYVDFYTCFFCSLFSSFWQ